MKDPKFKIPIDLNYFDRINKILENRRNIISLIKSNDIEGFKSFLQTHKIILNKSLKTENYWRSEDGFDILIYCIENNASLDLIKYIINLYDNLNYINECYFNYKYDFDYQNETKSKYDYNHYYTEEDSDDKYYFPNTNKPPIKTPLFSAITNKRYEMINLLLEKGSDINFQIGSKPDGDIIHLLYRYRLLNEDSLTYILDHGFHIQNIIESLDQELKTKNSYLLNFNFIGIIFEKYLTQESKKENQNKNFLIKNEWYKIAVDKSFYNLMEILLKHDSRDKSVILSFLYDLFDNDNDKNYSPGKQYIFINHIKNEQLKYEIEDYFMNKVSDKQFHNKNHKHKPKSQPQENITRKKRIKLS